MNRYVTKILCIFSLVVISSCMIDPKVNLGSKKKEAELKFNDDPSASGAGGTSNTGGGSSGDEESCQVQLTDEEKSASIAAFKSTVHAEVRSEERGCFTCHGDSKAIPPYFAVSDGDSAWQTILLDAKKIRIDEPSLSRIYLRLKDDRHNCNGDCDLAAEQMLEKINEWKALADFSTTCSVTAETSSLGMPIIPSMAQTEYGLLMLEAEQAEDLGAMKGRFIKDLDGKASESGYAFSPSIERNPNPGIGRVETVQVGNCEEITDPGSPSGGRYRVREHATHINSGSVNGNGVEVKDGYRPYFQAIQARLLRPERRLEYAKRLVGWNDETNTATGGFPLFDASNLALANGGFDLEDLGFDRDSRALTKIDFTNVPLTGGMVGGTFARVLPHFVKRESVFSGDSFINNPEAMILSGDGEKSIKLYDLFAPPMYYPTNADIRDMMEVGNFSTTERDLRKHVLYHEVVRATDDLLQRTVGYGSIKNLNRNDFLRLAPYPKYYLAACPNTGCTGSETIDFDTTSVSGGDILTPSNANDILKINGSGNGFIDGNADELEEGKAFRRIDIYAHVMPAGSTYPNGAANTDPAGNPSIVFKNASGDVIETRTYPIFKSNPNIDLTALYATNVSQISKDDDRVLFEQTLFPILRGQAGTGQRAYCMSCHNAGDNPRFSNASAVTSFDVIDNLGLVDFDTPANSFRKVRNGGDSIIHNCPATFSAEQCQQVETNILNGIASWKALRDDFESNLNNVIYKTMSLKERTPGRLEYKFKAKETGRYNVWLKVKGGNGLAENVDVRILDSNRNPVSTYNGINSNTARDACVNYNYGEKDLWTWFTPGRTGELEVLNAIGNLKKDDEGNELTVPNNRRYWQLEKDRVYSLQVFEKGIRTKIDLVAIDLVEDFDEKILDFQPDLLYRDENNIADYKPRILNYNITDQVGYEGPGQIRFKAEVKLKNGGGNYVFRNPRISAPAGVNVKVKGIKIFINENLKFTDASWTKINYITGRDRILTYAPLATLVDKGPDQDRFHFGFEELKLDTRPVADINPRGAPVVLIEGRKCRELDLFVNSVRPILRNARLMRKGGDGILQYINEFPGKERDGVDRPATYQCMTCHNDTHPYFKMTTFDYPEVLCAQALSRVDFENYRQSLIVRGLDGSGVHPKLYFIEELQYNYDINGSLSQAQKENLSVLSYNPGSSDIYNNEYIKNQAQGESSAYFSKWMSEGFFRTYTKSDLGIANRSWGALNNSEKDLARRFLGNLSYINYDRLPNFGAAITNNTYDYTWYDPLNRRHRELNGDIRTEHDSYSLTSRNFQNNSFNRYRKWIPSSASDNPGNRPYDLVASKNGNSVNKITDCSNGNQSRDRNGDCVKYNNTSNSDPRPAGKFHPDTVAEFELLKAKYRSTILNWIAEEHKWIKGEKR